MSGPAAGAPARDPGLQPERTRLAWRRTTLSTTVVAVLAAKAALAGGGTVAGVVACAVCCACWLVFLRIAHRRIRDLAAAVAPGAPVPGYAGGAVLCTVVMAVCGAALVWQG
ncbi:MULTISPECIES: DUF202 domain-containing protein [Streptomyces]|uniref:Uncharacterized membrane protein YidH (DUF202 family) n=1 Tax=Streptomyces calvus TaxID=67282 RepID=A0AA40SHL2_9ACTN|nr:DUF202 domain-containing protein [Streptomyces calvus]MBA8946686.1 uncharacterized membrane protein YidH (DUF202 family) [Streptomyces calvus]MBA8973620.1 uncharacterized membrane protein YidH (DUF202 family) [Streptomyces calvus]MYS27328.1 DUF202 domain-containing protein [Streptomyces sp. SID7804]